MKKEKFINDNIRDFLECYIEGSTITDIIYNVKKDKWIIKFNDKTKLEFSSFDEFHHWIYCDQIGE